MPPRPASGVKRSEHLFNFPAEALCGFIVPHEEERRVITGKGSHHITDLHVIQCGAGRAGKTGHGLEHHDILGLGNAGNTLTEDRPQLFRKIQLGSVSGHRILVNTLTHRLLDQVHLLDITGNGRLRAGNSPFLQPG